MVLISIGFLPSGFISYLIGERKREEKQVQLITGVSKMMYWTTAAIWDIMVRNDVVFDESCSATRYLFGKKVLPNQKVSL